MPRQIALLRGINLGARNRVSMPELRELLSGLGHEDVKTLLQSGNVVLTSDETGEALEQALEVAIAEELGVESRVVVRTARELAGVIKRDPFAGVADDPKRYQVSFLSAKPDAAVVRTSLMRGTLHLVATDDLGWLLDVREDLVCGGIVDGPAGAAG